MVIGMELFAQNDFRIVEESQSRNVTHARLNATKYGGGVLFKSSLVIFMLHRKTFYDIL